MDDDDLVFVVGIDCCDGVMDFFVYFCCYGVVVFGVSQSQVYDVVVVFDFYLFVGY